MLLSMRYFPALLFLECCAGRPAASNGLFWTTIFYKSEEGRRHILLRLKDSSAVSLTYNGQHFSLFGWEKGVRFPSSEYQEPVFSVSLSRETRQVPAIPKGQPRFKYTFTPELVGERKNLSPYLKEAFIRVNGLFADYLGEKNFFDPVAITNNGMIERLTTPWERLMYGADWRKQKPAIERYCECEKVATDDLDTVNVKECVLWLTNMH